MRRVLHLVILIILVCISNNSYSQFVKMADRVIVAGYVFEETSGEPLPYVNVYVKRTRRGTITDTAGYFAITAKVNDTLTFSSLGYDKKYVVINDSATDNSKPLIVFLDTRIYQINSIDIIALKKYKQLEFEITHMRLPDDDYIFALNNFPVRPVDIDYYERVNAPGFGLVYSPITALYNMFSKEGKELRKLEEVQRKDNLNNLINAKIGYDVIMKLTGMSQNEVNLFLDWCSFSPDFINKLTEYDLISVIMYKHSIYQKVKLKQE